jgi:carbon storage regulator
MLVLSRKVGERLVIGDDIVLIVNKVAGNRITLAIDAPTNVRIIRGELAAKESPAAVVDKGVERIPFKPRHENDEGEPTVAFTAAHAACG